MRLGQENLQENLLVVSWFPHFEKRSRLKYRDIIFGYLARRLITTRVPTSQRAIPRAMAPEQIFEI
jgi:hypothetical protein